MAPKPYLLPPLPPPVAFETPTVLKALVGAHRELALVRGSALSVPNPGILIDTLAIQEAQASSEIESIVTTQDDLYRVDVFPDAAAGPAKEVARYRDALRRGFGMMRDQQGLIARGTLVAMFRTLKHFDGGYRTLPGTELKNDRTGETVYVPPQAPDEIEDHMARLLQFVNADDVALDPLVRMAVIHHQFESIHPFPDGNGRLGRILNVLYLTRAGLLDAPILYLSRHITRTKGDYYRLLQAVRDDGAWEEWVLYMLEAVEVTSRLTVQLIAGLREMMAATKQRMRQELPKIYSQDLLNNLFRHPYTRIQFVCDDLGVSRPTATRYLELLTAAGIVEKRHSWRDNYYVNVPLVQMFNRAAA